MPTTAISFFFFNYLLEDAEFFLPAERKSSCASHVSQLVLELSDLELSAPMIFSVITFTFTNFSFGTLAIYAALDFFSIEVISTFNCCAEGV